jgi:integrase/recombinase XerD
MALPYFDDFLLKLKTDNYSDETVYNYERDLRVFEAFLEEDAHIPFTGFNKAALNTYKAYLVSRDRKTPARVTSGPSKRVPARFKRLSARSVNRMLSSLRSFLGFLIEQDLPCPVPPEAVTLVRTDRPHPRVADLEELVRLIEAPSTIEKNRRVALRNRAMLETLFSTGMRISELLGLRRDQIDGTGRVFIRGKGKKERFVYLTPRAHEHLTTYLASRKDDSPALFVPARGRNARKKDARISLSYLQTKIKEYRERLQINVPTSAHSLRHGFATYLAESGANPAAIQILLGHESLDTTTRYVNPSDQFAEDTHRKFHPLKKPS